MVEAGQMDKSTQQSFADFLGIPISTLKSARSKWLISRNLQLLLAVKCKVDIKDPSWNDPSVDRALKCKANYNYPGKDTPQHFKDTFLAKWKLLPARVHRLNGKHPKTLDVTMVSFSISDLGRITQVGQNLSVFLQLDITPARSNNGYVYGFTKANIRLFLDNDTSLEVMQIAGKSNKKNISGAYLKAYGNRFQPFWVIEAMNGVLNGGYSITNDPLFQLTNHEPGHTFDAALTVYPYDASLKRADGKPLPSRTKQAIIEILMRKKIGDLDFTGGLKLSVQELRIEGAT